MSTNNAQDPHQGVEELLSEARKLPLAAVDLNQVWQRLETPKRGPSGLGWAWLIPIAATVVLGALFLWPVDDNPVAIPGVRVSRPEFSARQFNPPKVVTPARPKPMPALIEAPPVVSETAPQAVPQPAPKPLPTMLPAPIAVVEAAPAVRPRVEEYQPRAIREFLRIDWQRWSNRALPAAVAEMIRLKDSKGLLAALDAMPLRHRGSDLLILRGRLRAQADRCVDARADLAAYPGDTQSDFIEFCAE